MKIRMKFSKNGPIKFIGHLDVQRYFQKVFRRAGVDISYSKGYSPHQILSFATPLGIGQTSDGDYLDAEFESVESSEVMLQKINSVMNEGIMLLEFKKLPDDAKNAMSCVAAADYIITFRPGYYDEKIFVDRINEFLHQEEILVTKKTKRQEKEMDILPLILDSGEVDGHLYLKLITGSEQNLKPALVMEAYCNYFGFPYEQNAFMVHRCETYMKKDGEYVPLSAAGEDIL